MLRNRCPGADSGRPDPFQYWLPDGCGPGILLFRHRLSQTQEPFNPGGQVFSIGDDSELLAKFRDPRQKRGDAAIRARQTLGVERNATGARRSPDLLLHFGGCGLAMLKMPRSRQANNQSCIGRPVERNFTTRCHDNASNQIRVGKFSHNESPHLTSPSLAL